MKTITLIIISLFTLSSKAQEKLTPIDGVLTLQKTIEVADKTKSDLYTISKKWIATTFKNPDKVLVFQDTTLGMMKLRYISAYRIVGNAMDFYNNIYLEIKDGKVRFTFKEIERTVSGPGYVKLEQYVLKKDGTIGGGMYSGLTKQVEDEANRMLNSYIIELNKKSDW